MRILLADNQPNVRFALRTLLERMLGAQVIGEAGDLEELQERLQAGCGDLLLLDWQLPGQEACNLMAAVRTSCPQLAVVALSGHIEDREAALEAGADAFVCKCDHPEELLSAIQQIERSLGAAEPSAGKDAVKPRQEQAAEDVAMEAEETGARR